VGPLLRDRRGTPPGAHRVQADLQPSLDHRAARPQDARSCPRRSDRLDAYGRVSADRCLKTVDRYKAAVYVIDSRLAGGMGASEAVPFGTRVAAEAFVRERRGRVVPLAGIPDAYVLGSPAARGRDRAARGGVQPLPSRLGAGAAQPDQRAGRAAARSRRAPRGELAVQPPLARCLRRHGAAALAALCREFRRPCQSGRACARGDRRGARPSRLARGGDSTHARPSRPPGHGRHPQRHRPRLRHRSCRRPPARARRA
jgi:hypothetical protein